MRAVLLLKAANAEREQWGPVDTLRVYPHASAIHLAVADLLDVLAAHVASHDCEAHCEPEGCAPVLRATSLAHAILEGAS